MKNEPLQRALSVAVFPFCLFSIISLEKRGCSKLARLIVVAAYLSCNSCVRDIVVPIGVNAIVTPLRPIFCSIAFTNDRRFVAPRGYCGILNR